MKKKQQLIRLLRDELELGQCDDHILPLPEDSRLKKLRINSFNTPPSGKA
ncbi:hypothetical protein P4S72_16345 [Vibrio sp. PP-XX7]